MNQIKGLKLKIKHSSMAVEQQRALYYQNEEAMHQAYKKFVVPLLCLGAFATTFTLVFGDKFRHSIVKIGKNIVKIGLKRLWL